MKSCEKEELHPCVTCVVCYTHLPVFPDQRGIIRHTRPRSPPHSLPLEVTSVSCDGSCHLDSPGYTRTERHLPQTCPPTASHSEFVAMATVVTTQSHNKVFSNSKCTYQSNITAYFHQTDDDALLDSLHIQSNIQMTSSTQSQCICFPLFGATYQTHEKLCYTHVYKVYQSTPTIIRCIFNMLLETHKSEILLQRCF